MTCYYPLSGYRSKEINPSTGKRAIVFNKEDGYADRPVKLPCGQCVGCRLERSRQWAVRCYHEASLYDRNCFLTLTYDDLSLPWVRSKEKKRAVVGSLHPPDFVNFMKRLRKKYGEGIRFYHCGEYGPLNFRPHHHCIIFNHDFLDKKLWKYSNDQPLFTSESLKELWPWGFSSIGDATFESAAYCARYILGKATGEEAKKYERVDETTGEVFELKPEYTTMSRMPGIGKPWLEKYESDAYPNDFIVVRGKKMRPPKFYDEQIEAQCKKTFRNIKRRRILNAKENAGNNTSTRLRVREVIQMARLKRLPRDLE